MDRSDAGTSSTNPNTFTNEGGKADDAEGAQIIFFNNSNAGNGSTFTNKAGTVEDAFPGGVIFRDSSREAVAILSMRGARSRTEAAESRRSQTRRTASPAQDDLSASS